MIGLAETGVEICTYNSFELDQTSKLISNGKIQLLIFNALLLFSQLQHLVGHYLTLKMLTYHYNKWLASYAIFPQNKNSICIKSLSFCIKNIYTILY